jgi:hypothetical protein
MKTNFVFFKKIASILLFFCLLALQNTVFAQGTTQVVRGKITDAASKAEVIGATVQVLNMPSQIATVTDVEGKFRLVGVPIGRITLKITYIGYEDITLKDLIVNAGKEVVLDLSMTESFASLAEVEVTYKRTEDATVTNNELATLSARPFNPSETLKYAGSLGDPSRMAANFAGVSGANDSRNDIVVRGNSPASLLWRVDGVNIPNPNHFGSLGTSGGPVSMLNNNLLAKSDFMTSAFPAEYGNALGSVFDIKLRKGNDEKTEFLGQMAFNGLELGAEGPFSKKSKASYLINYRYSLFSLAQAAGFKIAGTPEYQDFTAKIDVPVGKKGNFSAWTIYGNSKITLLAKDVVKNGGTYGGTDNNNRPNYETFIGAVSYEHKFSSKTYAKLTFSGSRTYQGFLSDTVIYKNGDLKQVESESLANEARFINEKTSLNLAINHKFNAKHKVVVGGIIDFNSFELFSKEYLPITKVLRDTKASTNLLQVYAQWKYRITQNLTLNSGVNAMLYALNNSNTVEPRIGLNYAKGKNSISIAYGLHSNLQPILVYFYQNQNPDGSYSQTNRNLGFTRSHHFVLGYERFLSENLRLKLETYYQSIFDAPIQSYASTYSILTEGANFAFTNTGNLVNRGTGTNYGVEMTLEKTFSKQYFFLLTTSLFSSKYKGSDGIERNTPFNGGYVVNLLAGKDFKIGKKTNVFTISWKVTTAGGNYITPIDLVASKQQGGAVYDRKNDFSSQNPAYFRTDLKFSFKINRKKLTHEIALDLQNFTGNQNLFQQGYDVRTNKITNTYQQRFLPIPFYRLTF